LGNNDHWLLTGFIIDAAVTSNSVAFLAKRDWGEDGSYAKYIYMRLQGQY
jgi:hypothetical protein